MLYVHQALRVARCCRCPDDRHAGEAGNGVLEYLESLAAQVRPKVGKARNIATWPGKTSDKARANRIGILRHDNRYRGSRFLGVMRGRRALSDDHAYPQTDQFVCKRAETVGLSFRKSILDGNILPNNVSQVAQAPLEGVSAGYHRGARVDAQKSNRDFIGCLLRARRERPRGCRAAEKRNEFAPFHSITSSAATSRPGGTVRPSAFAVLRLTIVSNLVAACTGRSAGLSPRRMRST